MEFNENKPIYLQISEGIMDAVLRGDQYPGARLPSVRDYATNSGVNPNTAMRTYNWLQQQGLIYMKRGIGYFVTDDAPEKILEMRRHQFFEHEATYFMERLSSFGITPDQLKTTYQEFLDNKDSKYKPQIL